VNQIDEVANWTSLIVSYLKDEVLPEDKKKQGSQGSEQQSLSL